jgi:transcriptional regulator with XRE-family HTH domain
MTKAEALKEMRHRMNMSQQEFAHVARLAVRTISVYENGLTDGSESTQWQLARVAVQHGFQDLAEILAPGGRFLTREEVIDVRDVVPVLERIEKLQAELVAENEKLKRILWGHQGTKPLARKAKKKG